MKSLLAFSLTLSTLVACAGNVSLGSGADGLKSGDPCSEARCEGQAIPEIGCAVGGEPIKQCVSNGQGACSYKLSCPSDPSDPNAKCSESECGPISLIAPYCLEGSSIVDPVCSRASGQCTWTPASCGKVVGADVTTLAAISPGGGFTPAPPAGSDCTYGEQSFTVTLAASSIKYSDCVDPGAGGALKLATGTKQLTASDLEAVKAAFEGLQPRGPSTGCVADLPEMRVEIANPNKTQTYYDARSECNVGNGRAAAQGVASVFQVMRKVAGLTQ